jgi:gliding motility-associated-like protein
MPYFINFGTMKRIPFFIALFFCFVSQSQNLIPNNSFENYETCPVYGYGETNYLTNWYDMNISADYYNCNVGVPTNNFGYQYAKTGTGYIGFSQSERVAVRLIQTLEAGKSYEFKMNVVSGHYGAYAADFSFFLSEDSLCLHSRNYDVYTIHLASNLTDTVFWTELSKIFTANGCEEYLALDLPFPAFTYYYFDDVSLECVDASGCVPPVCPKTHIANIPNIFSPNKDNINDEFRVIVPNTELSDFICTIYDRWGDEVIQINYPTIGWNGKNNKGDDVSDGVYYYTLNYTITECGEWISDQGYVHLVR